VEEDRRDAPEGAPLAHRLQLLEQRRLGDAELLRGRRVRLRHDRHVALERADRRDVELGRLDRVGLDRVLCDARRGEVLGPLLHLEVHPDLEQLQGRQLAHRLRARQVLEHLERALEPELRARFGGDREPHVEVVVAEVVVRDAGVRVDDRGRPVRVLRVDLRGDQHRAVAEHAGIEDRRHLADDPLVDQAGDAAKHLLLGHLGGARDRRVRARVEREAALHQVQQALVQLVQRDGGAVPAAAGLRARGRLPQRSHSATSLAK
jgi:hypothetical protein